MASMKPDTHQRRRRLTRPAIHHMLWQIRQQWNLLGFFEINREHDFFQLTCMMKEGLKASLQITIDNPVSKESQEKSDFTTVLKQIHEGFEMRTYAAPVFARFRQHLGMLDTDFQRSLSCENFYLQFISNSKSRANFFLTFDKRFFLKTQSKREIHFLLSNLPKYINHMERYPHSILVKFLGVYSIIAPQKKKRYFIIMQSVFYPQERMMERYDIKGCKVGRWTEPTPEGSEVIVVLKDSNFADKLICIDQERTWLMQQVKLDTQFLKTLDVIDYSFLVGLQPLQEDEQLLNKALAAIIARMRPSISCNSSRRSLSSGVYDYETPSSQASLTTIPSFEQVYKMAPDLLSPHWKPASERESDQASKNETFLREVLAPYLLQLSNCEDMPFTGSSNCAICSPSLSSLSDEMFISQHRRILPNSKNPLHTIDGPEYRYFVGIIDLFTVYGFRKKLEHLWKSIRYRGQQFSTVEPSYYAERFCQWVENHTV